jgi:hypothetical protein
MRSRLPESEEEENPIRATSSLDSRGLWSHLTYLQLSSPPILLVLRFDIPLPSGVDYENTVALD